MMTEEQYKLRYGATHEQWKNYNRQKQKEYRAKRGYKRQPTGQHCGFCGMLLSSEYHKLHPLRGCERYMQ